MSVHPTRRDVLAAGAAVLALALPDHAAEAGGPRCELDLFVFRAPVTRYTVLAVVCAARSGASTFTDSKLRDVDVHVGSRCWALRDVPPRGVMVAERPEGRWFAGEVLARNTTKPVTYQAVVLEIPCCAITADETQAVWAQVRTTAGARLRVGNPLVADVLARNPQLSARYHAVSPAEDRALFAPALAASIAALARSGGNSADAEAHGRKLALRLLPDVIAYCPDMPVGMTFARQNGRHPSDDANSVAATLLAGAVRRPTPSVAFALTPRFPYFRSAGRPV